MWNTLPVPTALVSGLKSEKLQAPQWQPRDSSAGFFFVGFVRIPWGKAQWTPTSTAAWRSILKAHTCKLPEQPSRHLYSAFCVKGKKQKQTKSENSMTVAAMLFAQLPGQGQATFLQHYSSTHQLTPPLFLYLRNFPNMAFKRRISNINNSFSVKFFPTYTWFHIQAIWSLGQEQWLTVSLNMFCRGKPKFTFLVVRWVNKTA